MSVHMGLKCTHGIGPRVEFLKIDISEGLSPNICSEALKEASTTLVTALLLRPLL